ncbi:hypothetical protein Tco_0532678 [Tanacetum coccineum]
MEKRKKHFAALRAQEKRSKLPTKAQKINTMSTYLKNIAGYKHNQLKSKSYDEIQDMFDKEMKRVNTFVDMNTELVKGSKTKVEGSSKRAGNELEQEKAKKQKGDDDQEKKAMKRLIKIVKDDEVTIDAIPLATKPPMIVDYKIDKDGRIGYFKLIRVYGSLKRYLSMIKMLQGNDERVDDLNGQGNDQGLRANGGIEGVNGNVEGVNGGVGGAPNFSTIIAQQLQNLLPSMLAQIEKMENMQDMSGCSVNQKVKYTAGSFVGKALMWWNSQIRMLSQEVTICGMVAKTEPKTIQKVMQISSALINEAVRMDQLRRTLKIQNFRKTLKMSEAENHPPASSVTALRIPIIKKGEYDLWCMKMRQYIAITDHILWDIITNGDQSSYYLTLRGLVIVLMVPFPVILPPLGSLPKAT